MPASTFAVLLTAHTMLTTITLPVLIFLGYKRICWLPHCFLCLGGGDPTATALGSSREMECSSRSSKDDNGGHHPSCAVSCHSYYNVQWYFPLERYGFFVLPRSSWGNGPNAITKHRLTYYHHLPCPAVFLATTRCLDGWISFILHDLSL